MTKILVGPKSVGVGNAYRNVAPGRASAHLRRYVSAAAILAAIQATPFAANAQSSAAATSEKVEEIVVTGSRIAGVDSFSTPTPVTTTSVEDLIAFQPLISTALNNLPMLNVGGSQVTSVATSGGSFATVNLRGLGPNRVLVLLDGRRFTPQDATGVVDTNLMPNKLISRVDIVTGGASAAYGSDAVAGVVNYVLNNELTGVHAAGSYGISGQGDRSEVNLQLGAGAPFAGGRGHVLVSGEVFRTTPITRASREWSQKDAAIISNPSGTPSQLLVTGAKTTAGSAGGLIVSGPLKGITFDAGGVPRQFQYGTLAGGTQMVGGEGQLNFVSGDYANIAGRITRATTFARATYDLTDSVTAFADTLVGYSRTVNRLGSAYFVNVPIQRDNAFLPASVGALMDQNNLRTITVGRLLPEFPSLTPTTPQVTWRSSVGVDFDIGNWKGEAYFQHGYNYKKNSDLNDLDLIRARDGADSVVVPAAGAPSTLRPGTVVCRSTLTNPGNGCIPVNILGVNSIPQPTIDLLTADENWGRTIYVEDVIATSISGEAFDLWAGSLKVATGLEYRHDSAKVTSDAYSQVLNPYTGNKGGYRGGNVQPFSGGVGVTEGFVELQLPVLDESPLGYSAEVSASARLAHYSTSGTVTSWKAGLTYRPVEDLLLRGTRSRDIRAPTLQELFAAGQSNVGTVNDPFRNNVTTSGVITLTQGNSALTPEKADTTVVGVTLQPSIFEGFSASVDYWHIKIADAVTSIGGQVAVDDCFKSSTAVTCSQIIRDPTTGSITTVFNIPVNLASLKTQGIDFELRYATTLSDSMGALAGDHVVFRALATKNIDYITQSPGGAPRQTVGENVPSIVNQGVARWKGNASVNYRHSDLDFSLQGTFISSGVYNNTYVEGRDINKNRIGSYISWDTSVGYRLPFSFQSRAYISVSNLLDRTPPLSAWGPGSVPLYTNAGFYDVIGRMFRVGITSEF